jgi:acyl-coenzyme A thioesterase PaaI-like protein
VAPARIAGKDSRIAVTHMKLENDDAELIAASSTAYVIG